VATAEKAGVGGTQFATVFLHYFNGADMRLFELFEAKTHKKKIVPSTSDMQKGSNPIAVAHQKLSGMGAGWHKDKKRADKYGDKKHKNADSDE
jgi:hypothetical protein